MSELYEAVLVIKPVRDGFETKNVPEQFVPTNIHEGVFAFLRTLPPSRRVLSVCDTKDFAQEISFSASSSIAVFFDNRIGLRNAEVYREGKLASSFDETNELWVPLDENGDPELNAPRFTLENLDPSEEYEVVVNAIDAALSFVGVSSILNSNSLRQFFCNNFETA